MENSLLIVFPNVQPIVSQNNPPFDQTNREFCLVLIFKRAINFLFYILLKTYLCSNVL